MRKFRISPLIQITLSSLYLGLTVPLPFLADVTNAPVSPWILGVGIGLGFVFLLGALSERVVVDDQGILVSYPRWFSIVSRKGWSLSWNEIKSIKMRTTGQGGLVYYFVSHDDQAFLLPMRIAGFAQLLKVVEANTSLDTGDIRPLSQPWMYFILLGLTLFLWLVDIWTIYTAIWGSII